MKIKMKMKKIVNCHSMINKKNIKIKKQKMNIMMKDIINKNKQKIKKFNNAILMEHKDLFT